MLKTPSTGLNDPKPRKASVDIESINFTLLCYFSVNVLPHETFI